MKLLLVEDDAEGAAFVRRGLHLTTGEDESSRGRARNHIPAHSHAHTCSVRHVPESYRTSFAK